MNLYVGMIKLVHFYEHSSPVVLFVQCYRMIFTKRTNVNRVSKLLTEMKSFVPYVPNYQIKNASGVHCASIRIFKVQNRFCLRSISVD